MRDLLSRNARFARLKWGSSLDPNARRILKTLTSDYQLSLEQGDLIWLDRGWYVTHTGLVRLARRSRCAGIQSRAVVEFCNPELRRWAFEATVYRTKACRGFVGYGDADPSNVSIIVQG